MTAHILNIPLFVAPRKRPTLLRPLDLLVAGGGMAIACCGYFASELSWLLALS